MIYIILALVISIAIVSIIKNRSDKIDMYDSEDLKGITLNGISYTKNITEKVEDSSVRYRFSPGDIYLTRDTNRMYALAPKYDNKCGEIEYSYKGSRYYEIEIIGSEIPDGYAWILIADSSDLDKLDEKNMCVTKPPTYWKSTPVVFEDNEADRIIKENKNEESF